MRRFKALVLFVFCLAAVTFYGGRFFGTSVVVSAVGGSLDAPTGVSASDGDYANKVGINWATIRGATSYRIFRNTINDSGTATDLGTTAANYFFDMGAVTSQSYFYWVRAESVSAMSSLSTPVQGVRAPIVGGGGGPFSPLDPPFAPPGNPVTATKAYLGKTLFWDEQLSSTRTVSCGTCHRPAAGGADPRSGLPGSVNPGPDMTFQTPDDIVGSRGVPGNNADGSYFLTDYFGMGVQVTGRVAPSYLNAGYATDGIFWDGRASNVFRDPITDAVVLATNASLESQSAGPPLSGAEMGHAGRNWTQAAAQIQVSKPLALAENIPAALEAWIGGRSYPELFEEAFGSTDVTPAKIAMAIATHERSIFSDRTPLDRAVAGIQPLQPLEEQGRMQFAEQDCTFCHIDSTLSDQGFHNIGVRPQSEDSGRFGVTNVPQDRGAFRTAGLRNVGLRPAMMHNGRFQTLIDVVEFYNRGGDFDATNINHTVIRARNMTQQQKDSLVAFMGRPLTDPRVANELPPFDRPSLYTESTRVPIVSGTGRVGAGGEEPQVTAIEPPLAGNPNFTVGLANVISGTPAVLVIGASDPGVGSTIPAAGSFAREVIQTLDSSGNGYGSVSLAIPSTPNVVGQTYFGRWYVTDAAAANGFAVSPLFQFTVFGDATAPQGSTRFDFDGDAKTDVGIFRPGPGEWWYLRSGNGGNNAFQFGAATDKIVPADYTGDGKTDVAFFRPSNGEWFILRSEDSSFYSFPFGSNGDIPAPGDFDGDGKADPAIFRPSSATWYILNSGGGTTITTFGANGDRPLVGDYDNDGKDDVAIFRPSVAQFWINRSTVGLIAFQFGTSTDRALVADFTGDGTDDAGFFRPATGEWYILRSEDGSFFSFPFGANGDVPVPGDYDGDGTADPAVFRPSNNTWYKQQSTNGFGAVTFGATGDLPVPSAFITP